MHPMLNIAVSAARSASKIILRHVDRLDRLNVDSKSRNNFVTEVDHMAEQAIIDTLLKAYPDHAILAEESGVQGESEYQWIIDPLDGTTNFLHGFPQFSVSIALLHRGKLEQAVVMNPLSQEIFTASRGKGAFLNDRRIRVTGMRGLEGSLLGTGFPYHDYTHLDSYLEMFRALLPRTAGIRRAGSAALDLAFVAAGRLDGFWEIGLNPWDIAAGALLVQEAGGLVSDFNGGQHFLDSGNIICGAPKVYSAMLKTIGPHLPQELRR